MKTKLFVAMVACLVVASTANAGGQLPKKQKSVVVHETRTQEDSDGVWFSTWSSTITAAPSTSVAAKSIAAAKEEEPLVTFECLPLGPLTNTSWTRWDVTTRSEAVGGSLEIIKPTSMWGGERSLAWASSCLSDTSGSPVIRFAFSRPIQSFEMVAESIPGATSEKRSLICYTGTEAGDFSGRPFKSDPSRAGWPPRINQDWRVGVGVGCGTGCGITACEIAYASVDNLVSVGIQTEKQR